MDESPIGSDAEFEALARRYVEVALSADAILGKGNLVDAFFATESITSFMDSSAVSSTMTEILHELKPHLASSNRHRVIDMIANLRAIHILLRLAEGKGTEGYDCVLADLLEDHVVDGTAMHERTKALQARLVALLSSIGYNVIWPKCVVAWNEDNAIEAIDYVAEMERSASLLKDVTFEAIVDKVIGKHDSRILQTRATIEFELVNDADWAANHVYRGNYESLIQINSHRRFNRHEAFVFASHEVYPGHHISAILREWLMSVGRLGIESTVTLLTMPSALVSEGVAECARILLPIELTIDQEIAVLLDHYITDTRHEFAHLVNTGKLDQAEATAEFARVSGLSPERAKQMIDFGVNWRYYAPAYSIGRHLVSDYLIAQATSGRNIDFKALFTASSLDSALA